jgi:hypothetical protein
MLTSFRSDILFHRGLLPALLLGAATIAHAQNNVGIGTTTPDASAVLDASSTTQGMLVPRMSAAQRAAVKDPATNKPATGLLVYQTDAPAGFYFYNGTAWTSLSGSGTVGATGPAGPQGATGATGPAGPGVPTGGTAGQVLSKIDATNYNTQWTTPSTGGSTLYTADGTLSANRSVGLNGKTLDFSGTGALGLNDNPLRLRATTDANNLLDYDGTVDGPILAGNTGGRLGYGTAAANTALGWGSNGVSINGGTNAYTLPATRGTSGQVLLTNGSGATTWTTPAFTAAYPSIELNVVNTTQQAIATLMQTASYTQLTFAGSNNANASLTGGNTWDGSTFRVGSTGAGWYQITMNLMGATSGTNLATAIGLHVFLDKNNALTNTPSTSGSTFPIAVSTYDLSTSSAYLKNSTKLTAVVYLAANEFLNLRGQSLSNSTTAYTSSDGSTSLTIVRLR